MDAEARALAAELHDGPVQELTLARLQVDLVRARVAEPGLAAELDAIAQLLDSASTELQRAVRAMRASRS